MDTFRFGLLIISAFGLFGFIIVWISTIRKQRAIAEKKAVDELYRSAGADVASQSEQEGTSGTKLQTNTATWIGITLSDETRRRMNPEACAREQAQQRIGPRLGRSWRRFQSKCRRFFSL